MPAEPTGPHKPISNLTTGPGEAAEQISAGETGTAPGVAAPAADGGETVAAGLAMMGGGAAPTGPGAALQDIGAASFGAPDRVLETVHGADNRTQVNNTADFPFRLNASLLITARDGSQWVGTAWFISPRTLITAGHCVFITHSGLPGRDGWVKSIQVMPGRNGTSLPFGSATSSQFWTVQGWAESGDENFDYGAIILPTPLGQQVGFLGFASLPDSQLTGAVANVTGYPGDKPTGTLWYDKKKIAALSASKVHYDIDTAGGQSGAAVYVIRNGERLAVAVHAYGGPTTNSGTRISAPVFANLTNWKA